MLIKIIGFSGVFFCSFGCGHVVFKRQKAALALYQWSIPLILFNKQVVHAKRPFRNRFRRNRDFFFSVLIPLFFSIFYRRLASVWWWSIGGRLFVVIGCLLLDSSILIDPVEIAFFIQSFLLSKRLFINLNVFLAD